MCIIMNEEIVIATTNRHDGRYYIPSLRFSLEPLWLNTP